jgi:glycosyltransferase involved in cell wall biosynthesis
LTVKQTRVKINDPDMPGSELSSAASRASAARRPKEILYIVWAFQAWPFFEWICRELHGRLYNFSFLLMHPGESPLAAPLDALGVAFRQIPFRKRSDLPSAAWEVYRFCRARRFDLVHTHFMNACLAGLPAAALAGIQVRLHTRHHGSPHRCSHRKPWELLFDSFNNRFSTVIVAPCQDVRRRLFDEGVEEDRVVMIHHGFDLQAFRNVSRERIEALRRKYGIPAGPPIIGSLSRFIRPKGLEYVIEAFRALRRTHPDARLVLANARGPDEGKIHASLARLPADSYAEIPYEPDVFALYRIFDVFTFAPVAPHIEGFGQTYVEALASGVPSIFTKAGAAHELIRHRENAWVVDYENSGQIHEGMKTLLEDADLRAKLIRQGQRSAEAFDVRRHVAQLDSVYCGLLAANQGGCREVS